MSSQAARLRALIEAGEHFIAADAYSALTGRIVEQVGFKAAYLGGHACSAFHYAVPDNGVFSQVEQLDQAERIAAAIDIPLIVDADTLGETVADAFHFTRRYVRAGIAGFHVEDEVNPKHSTYSGGLLPIPDMQARLRAAAAGRGDSPLVIIARCDELYPDAYRGGGTGSVEEATRRGRAYAEAGADVLTFPLATPEVVAQLAAALPVPIGVIGFPVPDAVLTMHPGWGWLSAAQVHLKLARELFEHGTVTFDHNLPEKNALLEQDRYDALVADWAGQTGRPARP